MMATLHEVQERSDSYFESLDDLRVECRMEGAAMVEQFHSEHLRQTSAGNNKKKYSIGLRMFHLSQRDTVTQATKPTL